MGGSSCGREFSPGWGSAEMISDSRSHANRKMLIKGISEHLLPTTQTWWLGWPGPPVTAPCTRNRQVDAFGYLILGQALITELQDLLCGSGMSGSATTHSDPSAT
jgi:hypothetical protein